MGSGIEFRLLYLHCKCLYPLSPSHLSQANISETRKRADTTVLSLKTLEIFGGCRSFLPSPSVDSVKVVHITKMSLLPSKAAELHVNYINDKVSCPFTIAYALVDEQPGSRA